jgi:hypothetical protein
LKTAQSVYKKGEAMLLGIEEKKGRDHIVEAKAAN